MMEEIVRQYECAVALFPGVLYSEAALHLNLLGLRQHFLLLLSDPERTSHVTFERNEFTIFAVCSHLVFLLISWIEAAAVVVAQFEAELDCVESPFQLDVGHVN